MEATDRKEFLYMVQCFLLFCGLNLLGIHD